MRVGHGLGGGVGGFSSGLVRRKMIGGSDLLCAGGHIHAQLPVEYPSGKPLKAKLLKEFEGI